MPANLERRRLLHTLLLAGLTVGSAAQRALAGIPPRSLPRLIRLQDELAAVDPAQLQIAIQLDQDLIAATRSAPVLALSIHPVNPGGFIPIDELLPMQALHPPALPAGLAMPPAQRAWLLFGLGGPTQARLRALQERLRGILSRPSPHSDARVVLTVQQQALLPGDRGHQRSHWETWLQSAQPQGWYLIWSGTVQELAAESRAES